MSGRDLIDKCRGRWKGILVRFGVPENYLDGKHHGCPICGEGEHSHRFRFDNKNGEGTWICTQCGAGYGLRLVERAFDCTTSEAMQRIECVVDEIPVETSNGTWITERGSLDILEIKSNLNKLWLLSDPLCGSDFVSLYLHKRGLVLTPLNVRYNNACYESDSKTKLPAMVARIQNNEGVPVGIHRIFIDNNVKAKIASPEQMMPATESLKGSAIRLFSSQDKMLRNGILGIAEGLETAIACTQLYSIATWACINAPLMHSWRPPAPIKKVVVFADNDANYVGQEAAYRLGHTLHSRGLIVKVVVPPDIGTDFNDILGGVNNG